MADKREFIPIPKALIDDIGKKLFELSVAWTQVSLTEPHEQAEQLRQAQRGLAFLVAMGAQLKVHLSLHDEVTRAQLQKQIDHYADGLMTASAAKPN